MKILMNVLIGKSFRVALLTIVDLNLMLMRSLLAINVWAIEVMELPNELIKFYLAIKKVFFIKKDKNSKGVKFMSELIENYPFRDEPITAKIVVYWATKIFPPAEKFLSIDLVDRATELHVKNGGKDSESDKNSIRKNALIQLRKNNLCKKEGSMYILLANNPDNIILNSESENDLPDEDDEPLADGLEWLGEGRETVYVYSYPVCIELAKLKHSSFFQIKVGRTNSRYLNRVCNQVGTCMPEYPVIFFGIRCDDCKFLEDMIHHMLDSRKRSIKDAPGSEWFMTSVEEVREVLQSIDPKYFEAQTKQLDTTTAGVDLS